MTNSGGTHKPLQRTAEIGMIVATSLALLALIPDYQLRHLRGGSIVDVGSLDHLSCPVWGDYDCLSWPSNLYKFSGNTTICFEMTSYGATSSLSAAAALIQSKSKEVYVLFRAGVGQKYEIELISTIYECPSTY